MRRATFPTMLTHKARIIGGFTRRDLVTLGVSYFVLSLMHISGISQLFFMAGGMFLLKYLQKKLPLGFFRNLHGPRRLMWSYRLGGHK